MKALIVALTVVASLVCVSEASAFHGFGRRSNVVVQAGGANVFVGNRGFGRQQVIVQPSPFVVRQQAVFVQPFVQQRFVHPFAVQSFGVQPVYGVQSCGVQSFNGGCGAFFVR